jgi:steroid delta-isomerase-like uncharacterized protein
MSLEENKALVRRFIEEVQNQHKLAAIDELFSPEFVDHSASSELKGTEGTKVFFTMMFAAFPDMHFTVVQQIAEGDQVMTHKTFHGTHQGSFMGIPASGKHVSIDTMDVLAIHDGKITDHWTVADMLSMLQQIGAVSAPG